MRKGKYSGRSYYRSFYAKESVHTNAHTQKKKSENKVLRVELETAKNCVRSLILLCVVMEKKSMRCMIDAAD
jgi:hypothetical protein